MECRLPGSSAHGLFKQEYWSGLPCPSPWDFLNTGIEPVSPVSPALAREKPTGFIIILLRQIIINYGLKKLEYKMKKGKG